MQRTRKLIALRRALDEQGRLKGDELVSHCPKCKHHKTKLSVNLVTDFFHCWVCGWGGSNILLILALDPERSFYDEYKYELDQKHGKIEKVEKKHIPVVLPREFVSLSDERRSLHFRQAIAYLADRGVSADDMRLYKLGFCEEGEYKNRVIFPSFDEFGELNFFYGRSIYKSDLKYKHGEFDKDVIYNDLLVDWKFPITIVEGPMDAIKAGSNAVPVMGSRLREGKLLAKIVHSKVPVYVALDNPNLEKRAGNNLISTIDLLMSYGVEVRHVHLGLRKDPGECSRQEFDEFVRSSVPLTSGAYLKLFMHHGSTSQIMKKSVCDGRAP